MRRKTWQIFRLVVIAISQIVMLSSCEKEDIAHSLSFRPSVESDTKAVIGEGFDLASNVSMMSDGEMFKVFATYHQGSSDVNVFINQPQTVTYDGDNTIWEYYNNGSWEYWKPSANYKFRAFYPGNLANIETSSNSSQLFVDYKTGVSGAPDNYDLTVAYAERSPFSDGFGPINLIFKHALAAVKIKVIYNNTVVGSDKLTSLYLRNLIQSATLMYSTEEGNEVIDWSRNQGINYHDRLYAWSNSEGLVFSSTKAADAFGGKYIFVIPQTIGSEQAAVYFQTEESGSTVNLGFLPAITWLPGKVYQYTFVVSASKLDVEVSIKPWSIYRSENDIVIN